MILSDYLDAERGRAVALASAIGVPPESVSQWRRVRPVPVERCAEIERETSGAVSCEDLRPDVVWSRIKDGAWPWHKHGRPLLDISAAAREVA